MNKQKDTKKNHDEINVTRNGETNTDEFEKKISEQVLKIDSLVKLEDLADQIEQYNEHYH